MDWKNKNLTILVMAGNREGVEKCRKILSICAIDGTVTVGYNSTEADAITALENNAEFAGVVEGEDNVTLTVGEWTAVDTFDGTTVDDYTFEAEVSAPEGYVFGDDVDTTVTATVSVQDYTAEVATINVDDVSLMEGTTADLTVEVLDQYDNAMEDVTLTYTSGDEAVFTVDETGTVTAGEYVEDANTATVTVSANEVDGTATVTVTEDELLTAEEDAEAAIAGLPALEELTLEDEAAVVEARTLVDDAVALGVAEEDIEGLADLEAAEAKIDDLNAAAEVDATIEALSAPAELTFEEKTDVEDARADYDALTEEQQAYVENLTVLEAAEAVYAEAATAVEVVDAVAAADVRFVTLTADVDTVEIDTDKEGDVTLNTENDSVIDGDLTVTAPELTFNNDVEVTGTITIQDVADSTWNQNAPANEIVVNATGDTINIHNTVASATFNVPATVTGGSNVENAVIKDNGVEMDEDPQDVDTENSEYDRYVVSAEVVEKDDMTVAAQSATKIESPEVFFKLYDKYGEQITAEADLTNDSLADALDVTTFVEGSEEVSTFGFDGKQLKVTLDSSVEYYTGHELVVELTSYDVEANELLNESFAVVFNEEPVPTTLEISSADVVEGEIEITESSAALEAVLKDQYGSVMNMPTGATLRWDIETGFEEERVVFNDTTLKDGERVEVGNLNDVTLNISDSKEGAVEVTAVLIDGADRIWAEENITFEIVPKALESISLTDLNPETEYNNEEIVKWEVEPNEFSVLDIDKMDVEVVDANGNASAVLDTNEDGDIVVKLTTTETGTYDVKVTHESPVEGEDAFKDTDTITTTLNPNPKTIEVASFEDNELTAGTEVKKEVTFKNKHGEAIDVDAADVAVTSSDDVTVKAYDKDGNEITLGDTATPVSELGFEASAAGDYTVNISSEEASTKLNLTAVEESSLDTVEVDSSVTVINDDDKALEDNDLIVDSGDTIYKLLPVTFKDQYGNEIDVPANTANLSIESTNDANIDVQPFKAGDKDSERTAITDDTLIAYIGVAATGYGDVEYPVEETLTVTNNIAEGDADRVEYATIDVTVNKTRTLDSISVDPTSGSAVVDANKTFTLSGVDQYGESFALSAPADVLIDSPAEVSISGQVTNDDDADKVDFDLSSSQAGSYTVKVYYDANNDDVLDTDEKSVEIPFEVGQVGDKIDSLTIVDEATVNPADEDAYTVDTSQYPVEVAQNNTGNTVDFDVKAFDGTEELGFDKSSLILTVTDNSLAYAENTTTPSVAVSYNGTDETIKVTINNDDVDELVSGTFTVKATAPNGVYTTKTVEVSSAAREAQSGTYYLTLDGETDELSSLTIDQTTAKSYNLNAKDQYNQVVNVVENSSDDPSINYGQDSNEYFEVTSDGVSINIAPKSTAGTSKLRVFVDGTQEIAIDVTVPEDIATELANEEAVSTDKGNLDETSLTYADGEDSTSVTSDVALPTTGANGTTISWSETTDTADVASLSESLVAITQDTSDDTNDDVTLTATISKGDASDTKDVTFTVLEGKAPTVTTPQAGSITIDDTNTTSFDIVFSEELSATGKSNVEAALDAVKTETTGTVSYAWATNTLTVSGNEATYDISFDGTNAVTVDLEDLVGNTTTDATIITAD